LFAGETYRLPDSDPSQYFFESPHKFRTRLWELQTAFGGGATSVIRQSILPELLLRVTPQVPAANAPRISIESTSASSAQFLTFVQKFQANWIETEQSIACSNTQCCIGRHSAASMRSVWFGILFASFRLKEKRQA
jgi:hypothetical protein